MQPRRRQSPVVQPLVGRYYVEGVAMLSMARHSLKLWIFSQYVPISTSQMYSVNAWRVHNVCLVLSDPDFKRGFYRCKDLMTLAFIYSLLIVA